MSLTQPDPTELLIAELESRGASDVFCRIHAARLDAAWLDYVYAEMIKEIAPEPYWKARQKLVWEHGSGIRALNRNERRNKIRITA